VWERCCSEDATPVRPSQLESVPQESDFSATACSARTQCNYGWVVAITLQCAGIDAVLPSVLPHTVEGIKAIGAWAEKHPVQTYMLYNVIKELVPGAKKAIGLAKALPTD
jgi:hypothetical protein